MLSADTLHDHVARLTPLSVPLAIALVPQLDLLDDLQRRRVVKALHARKRATFDSVTLDMAVSAWRDILTGNPDRDTPHRVGLREAGLDQFLFEAFDWCADLLRLNLHHIEGRGPR